MFKVGDVVTVRNDGYRYGSYFRFFEANKAPYNIAARYQHDSILGPDYFASKLFEVVFVGKHEDEDIPIYAIANRENHDFAPVYLFGESGLSLLVEHSYTVDVDTTFSISVKAYSESEAVSKARSAFVEGIHCTTLSNVLTYFKPRNAIEEVDGGE